MFEVIAVQHALELPVIVYTTNDRENCSAYAESHFIRTGAHLVIARDKRKNRPLCDKDGKEYIWKRPN